MPTCVKKPDNLITIATALAGYQRVQAYEQAIALLAEKIELLLQQAPCMQIRAMLDGFPPELYDASPELLHIQAFYDVHTELLARAATNLQRAGLLYLQRGDANRAAACQFELVRIYQRREDFHTAHLYVQEAEALLQKVTDEHLHADLLLRLATLCPDIGRLHEGIDYARQALVGFQAAGNIEQQFKALLLMACVYRQLGQYQDAAARLEMARSLQASRHCGVETHAQVLNAETHLAWYRGRLAEALQNACVLHDFTHEHDLGKQQVYSATLLGNVQRAAGEYVAAQKSYAAARRLARRFDLTLYLPWLDGQESWLKLLQGDFVAARRLIHQALETADRGQIMSFNVNLALLNALSERYHPAESLLLPSLDFYTGSGDALAVATIRFYLAHLHFHTGRIQTARVHVRAALGWLAERNACYFPLWWHPQMACSVCAFAIVADIVPLVAERMLARHVGKTGLAVVRALCVHEDVAVRQRAECIREQIDDSLVIELDHVKNKRTRQVLESLLAEGILRRESFAQLQAKLTTAQHRRIPNPRLVAVFGLYVDGDSPAEIAAKLGGERSSVRNAITTIYQIFELPQAYGTPSERKKRLVEMAAALGYVGRSGQKS